MRKEEAPIFVINESEASAMPSESALPTDPELTREYDPDGSIHEAVLAAKDKHKRAIKKPSGGRSRLRKPGITPEQIITWADRYHELTGDWPHRSSGEIVEATGVTWFAVDSALKNGLRVLSSTVSRMSTGGRLTIG
jgi:hypothetical protein